MLTRQYSLRTVNAYLSWISNFIHFHNRRYLTAMGDNEVFKLSDPLILK
ncbi:phage integrase N-terminal SAM-like domain-containing protein [Pseudoalteromonas sp. CnMc7-15]